MQSSVRSWRPALKSLKEPLSSGLQTSCTTRWSASAKGKLHTATLRSISLPFPICVVWSMHLKTREHGLMASKTLRLKNRRLVLLVWIPHRFKAAMLRRLERMHRLCWRNILAFLLFCGILSIHTSCRAQESMSMPWRPGPKANRTSLLMGHPGAW